MNVLKTARQNCLRAKMLCLCTHKGAWRNNEGRFLSTHVWATWEGAVLSGGAEAGHISTRKYELQTGDSATGLAELPRNGYVGPWLPASIPGLRWGQRHIKIKWNGMSMGCGIQLFPCWGPWQVQWLLWDLFLKFVGWGELPLVSGNWYLLL